MARITNKNIRALKKFAIKSKTNEKTSHDESQLTVRIDRKPSHDESQLTVRIDRKPRKRNEI